MAGDRLGIAEEFAAGYFDLLAQGSVGAALRAVTRETNTALGNAPPTPDQLLQLFYRGQITRQFLENSLLWHAIGTPGNTGQGEAGLMARQWNRWINSNAPTVGVAELRQALKRGLISESVYLTCLDYHGFASSTPGSPADLDSVRNQTRETVKKLTAPLTIDDVQTLLNWELMTNEQAHVELWSQGHVDNQQQSWLKTLRYEVPGPSDLVRFAIRHVFEPDLLAHFGFNDEYRPVLDIYHHAHGMEYPIFTGPLKHVVEKLQSETGKTPDQWKQEYTSRGLPEPTWAHSYWWSHWILPSPTQGYEMYQRLRPERMHLFTDISPGVRPFTLQDLNLLLRGNDYPPYFRPELVAINFRTMTRVDIRRAYQIGAINREEVFQRYRDLGYDPTTSRVLQEIATNPNRQTQRQTLNRRLVKCLENSYAIGSITQEEAQRDLASAMRDERAAELAIRVVDCEYQFSQIKRIVAAIRARFIRAETSEDQAMAELRRSGISPQRQANNMIEWRLLRMQRGKMFTVAQLQRAYLRGLLVPADYVQRLVNLGYERRDADILLAMANEDRAMATARAAQATARTRAQRRRAAEAELRAVHRRARELGQYLAGYGTILKWAGYVLKGTITNDEYYRRTRLTGISDNDAYEYIRSAAIKLPRSGVEPPPPPTGTPGIPPPHA